MKIGRITRMENVNKKKHYDTAGYLLVTEKECCNHFEPDQDVLVAMKECWCCKWADFRKIEIEPRSCPALDNDEKQSLEYSVCHYEKNRSAQH